MVLDDIRHGEPNIARTVAQAALKNLTDTAVIQRIGVRIPRQSRGL
jgi:hypothetical protein